MIAPMPLPAGLTTSKVIAVHLNYRSRAAERGRTPSVPSYFLKPPSTLAGDGDLVRPRGTELLGYEGEIAVVIGTRAHRVAPEDALAHVGWFAAANDAGIADFRWNDRGSNLFSKGQDGFTPIGPAVTAGDVDPQALVLRTRVNGEVVQEDVAANLIFSFADLIADITRFITLEPGDVILTGTPTGTGVLDLGDVVEVELEGAGSVRSRVVEADHDIEAWGAGPKVTPEVRSWATGDPVPRAHELTAEAWEMLHNVGTATLTQQLQRRGVRNSWIRGVHSTRPDLRLVGYARTLRYVALREDVRDADKAPLNAQKAAIEAVEPREALVIEAREDPGAGTIGDILVARVLARGGTGVITDGGLRDSPAVAGLDIPTYFQAPHGSVLGLVHYPLESMVPVTCGGVLVMPGDVMVGDAEGVVVVPAAMAEEVAHDATEQELREEWALERVQAGDSVRDTFPMAPERRAEFEAWRAERAGD
jgi:5-oxopent-3-ene-1,2,5-tricarboxylate decarboxylase / 2-hydroxyhepta-2,4-diene-1,7-dioate isomerase